MKLIIKPKRLVILPENFLEAEFMRKNPSITLTLCRDEPGKKNVDYVHYESQGDLKQ